TVRQAMSTTTSIKHALLLAAAFAATSGAYGCGSDRPARNGVFNENVYLRKDFLVRSGDSDDKGNPTAGKGWILKATITDTSSPNPLGGLDFWPGLQSIGPLVRLRVAEDHLEMLAALELSSETSAGRVSEVIDAWN